MGTRAVTSRELAVKTTLYSFLDISLHVLRRDTRKVEINGQNMYRYMVPLKVIRAKHGTESLPPQCPHVHI